jgi:hypothetical protein
MFFYSTLANFTFRLSAFSSFCQVDFISSTEKSYELSLVLDLDGVGQELSSIPIFARCLVPTVAFEPQVKQMSHFEELSSLIDRN